MTSDNASELDPEVLADPLGPSDDDQDSSPSGGESLVPSSGRSLAPFDPFRRYVAELRKYRPLSREEEQALSREYRRTGDREALFQLVTANLMLVVRIARSFRRAAHNLLDLIQEGNLGLLQAIERFDPEVGVRLPTYAAWWVRAYMVKFLLDNVRLVRVGTTNARRKLLRNLRQEKERLEAKGFEVGTRLLAEHFDVSEDDVRDVHAALVSRDVSIDAPVGGDNDGPTAGEALTARDSDVEEEVGRREMQQQAEAAIARFGQDLGDRDQALLGERILSDQPKTLQEIGDRFGTSREAVRQAEVRLMKRLESYLREELGDLGQVRIGPK